MRIRKSAGFTVLELAIVLVIVGVVTGMGLVATMGALEGAKRVATNNRLDAIEKALMNFRMTYDRLPCPAELTLATSNTNYGVQAATPGTCTGGTPTADAVSTTGDIVQGAVPVKTLGLPNDFMYDAWGRRILYTVMSVYTFPKSFATAHPKETCGTNVLASSTSGDVTNSRSSNAVYTLTSFGPNGHGGYTQGATIVNAGSTNDSEQRNCRCSSSAVLASDVASASVHYSVQKDASQSTSSATDVFDDIVRYKERWQMQTDDDYRNFSNYVKMQMVIGYTYTSGSGSFQTYQKQCATYVNNSTTVATTSDTYKFVGLSMDNSMLFSYSNTNNCELFSVSGTTVTKITSAPAGYAPNTGTESYACPTYNSSNGVAMQDDYLAITNSTSPYVKMWKLSNGQMGPMNISFYKSTSTDNTPASQPDIVAISKNAEYVALSRTTATAYTTVYQRTGNILKPLSSQPTGMPAGTALIAFSKDGKYLVARKLGTPTATDIGILKMWRLTAPGVFSEMTGVSGSSTNELTSGFSSFGIASVAFSPDGQYMALGSGRTSGTTNLRNVLRIYQLTPNAHYAYETPSLVTYLNNTSTGSYSSLGYSSGYTRTAGFVGLEFTPDSSALVAIEGSSVNSETRKVLLLRRRGYVSGAMNYEWSPGVTAVPNSARPSTIALFH